MRRSLIILPALLSVLQSAAQDIHYSQFYNAPLTINPALTGVFNGNFRVVANHRSQWASISNPYFTSSVSVDSRLGTTILGGDGIGAGLSIMNDISGPADLRFTKVMASGSYVMVFGEKLRHSVSIGIQGGFFQRGINEKKLVFENQFNGFDFDGSISSGENLAEFSTVKPDFQAGAHYTVKGEGFDAFGGASLFHLTRPNESILDEFDNLSRRFLVHGGAVIAPGRLISAAPAFMVVTQNHAREITAGGSLIYAPASGNIKSIDLFLGSYYRAADAIILSAGGSYGKWKAGVSYDINLSSLSPASGNRGGFELSLIYVDRWMTSENTLPVIVPCPRL